MQIGPSVHGSVVTPHTDGSPEDLPDTITSADLKTVFLGGLFLLACLATCYVASEIILPVMLAFVLMLVLQPVIHFFEKLHLPRAVGALAIIIVIIGGFVVLGAALSGPIASWGEKIPGGLPRLQERLTFLGGPIKTFQKFLHQAEDLTQGEQPAVATVAVKGSGLNDKVLDQMSVEAIAG
jgi:predicted PurR-regulated permease PerM